MILPIFLPFLACNKRCIYCEQESITGLSLKDDSLDFFVEKQIEAWLSHADISLITEVAFYGGNFGAIGKPLRKKLYYKAHSLGISAIRYSTRPDTIKDELLREAEAEGVSLIELGVQSLNDEVLKANNRPYNKEMVFKAIESILKVTSCGVQLMSGMFKQKNLSLIEDAKTLSAIKAENGRKIKCARIYPTAVYSGTKLAEYYNRNEYKLPSFKETLLNVSGAYITFLANNIDVIRIGLPAEAENSKEIATSSHKSMGDIARTFLLLLYFNLNQGNGAKFSKKYSGFKRACIEEFGNLFESDEGREVISNIDLNEAAKIVMEHYFENSIGQIEGKADYFAERLASKAYNR